MTSLFTRRLVLKRAPLAAAAKLEAIENEPEAA